MNKIFEGNYLLTVEQKEYIEGLEKQLHKEQLEVDKVQGRGYIGIMLVDYGYQIDILDWKAYIEGKVKTLGSECRDYGNDVDAEKFGAEIIEFIRKGKD
jgi:hypothetical protein